MAQELLKGDSKTLNALGEWGIKPPSGGSVTAAGGVLVATPSTSLFFFESTFATCVKAQTPMTVAATFEPNTPMAIGTDYDPAETVRVQYLINWLTEIGGGSGGFYASTFAPIPVGVATRLSWDVPASDPTTKFFELIIQISFGRGANYTLYMTDPSIIGVSCKGVIPPVRQRQIPSEVRQRQIGRSVRQRQVPR